MSDIKMNFDTDVAKHIGTDCAIILSNIEFWQATNKANKRNLKDGRYWTYNSAKAFSELFSYLSESQIRRCLVKLEDNGYIVSGNYNNVGYDRTKWYSSNREDILRNRQMEITKSSNGSDGSVTPIPDSKPNDKPNIINADVYESLLNYIKAETGKKFRVVSDKVKSSINARLKEGFTEEEIKIAISNAASSKYHKDNNYQYLTLELITRPDMLDKWFNASVKAVKKSTYQPSVIPDMS